MSRFEVENRSGELIIRWKNRPMMRWFMLFFALVWNGVMSIVFFAMLMGEDIPIWVSLHFMVGLGVAYFTLVLFLNKNQIAAGRSGLNVHKGPIPTFGGRQQYDYEEVDQLHVKQSGSSTTNGRTTYYYALCLRTKGGKDKTLAGWLKQTDALELERRIEDHLGIEDAPIPLEGRAVDMLRKWKPEWADKVEEMHRQQQGKGKASSSNIRPRRVAGPEHDYAPQLQHAEPGFIISLRGNNLAMTEGKQIDWKDPELSDRLLSVYDATQGENYFLYCEQLSDDAWTYFEERPLDQEEYAKIGWLGEQILPAQLANGDDIFRLHEQREGVQFSMPGARVTAVQQRIYQDQNEGTRFRIYWTKDQQDYQIAIQERLEAGDIGDVLAD